MILEECFDFLSPDDIRIKGHRIGIDNVIDYYLQGLNPEQIQDHFPSLSLEQIYATITYYLYNKKEIDAYRSRLNTWREQRYQESLTQESAAVVQRMKVLTTQRKKERTTLS
ncbi:MAG: DUF433 domain-containing protein [Xenococcus sp. (in: cyanobacteria)]